MSNQITRDQIIQKAWEDDVFKQQLLADPKAAIKDAFGVDIPDNIEVTAVEETPEHAYLVIPPKPSALRTASAVEIPAW
ncbi:NHLP leader peptide domain-containing protein [Paenibacillus catalpae]|uniref:NHLP leader peptide domain-containing protein n=1 Tax=Paenibacillus catalpae TaxID=1045775 RepID=A0A1I2HMJ1_9BACL|nr:NHLP leader peptide family RiPP precursor [Paenibacillus catalpae]SFF29976.1 NHLP leader peptide domain-containing protein [Paenibacillus catalpae]